MSQSQGAEECAGRHLLLGRRSDEAGPGFVGCRPGVGRVHVVHVVDAGRSRCGCPRSVQGSTTVVETIGQVKLRVALILGSHREGVERN